MLILRGVVTPDFPRAMRRESGVWCFTTRDCWLASGLHHQRHSRSGVNNGTRVAAAGRFIELDPERVVPSLSRLEEIERDQMKGISESPLLRIAIHAVLQLGCVRDLLPHRDGELHIVDRLTEHGSSSDPSRVRHGYGPADSLAGSKVRVAQVKLLARILSERVDLDGDRARVRGVFRRR